MRINIALLSLVFLTGCIFPSAFEQDIVLQKDGSDADGDTEVGVADATEVSTSADIETDVGDNGETDVVDEVVDVPADETQSDTVADVEDTLDVPTCENGNFDPDGETDVDCGGSCAPCGVGSACLEQADCESRICDSGFCQARGSCLQWLRLNGALVDGVYPIDPDGVGGMDAFEAYCNMTEGGWTLAFNVGTLIASQSGSTTQVCYNESCINAAYSTIPIADLMFDVSNASIVGENQEARTVVEGVHSELAGRTLQQAFTAGTKLFVEAEDNSNVTNGEEVNCSLTTPWQTWRLMICGHFVIVFNDVLQSGKPTFISLDNSWTNPYTAVYGWDTYVSEDWFPSHFRVWVREEVQ